MRKAKLNGFVHMSWGEQVTKSPIVDCESGRSPYCRGKFIPTRENPKVCLYCKRFKRKWN